MREAVNRVAAIAEEFDNEKQSSDELALYADFIEALAEESIYDLHEIAEIARTVIAVRDMPFRRI